MVAWQNRPLDAIYPVVLIDAIVVKIRDGQVANRPIYVAMGINLDGERDVLGMWVGRYAAKKHWSRISRELREIYTAPTPDAAEARFGEFAEAWRDRYPAMIATWERSWGEFVPFLEFPVELRQVVYTTNAASRPPTNHHHHARLHTGSDRPGPAERPFRRRSRRTRSGSWR
jgi:transposase-like protein